MHFFPAIRGSALTLKPHEHMASIYYRGKPPGGCWWVQFYHPRSGELCRFSLATGDRYGAEVIRRRVELEVELRRPELQLQAIPVSIVENLGPAFPAAALNDRHRADRRQPA